MMTAARRGVVAIVLTAFAAASPYGPALAKGHSGSPASTFAPAYLDSDRCRVLAEQLNAAHARSRPEYGNNVANLGAAGVALCDAGDFATGADELEKAVHLIGETPAKPHPVTRLH